MATKKDIRQNRKRKLEHNETALANYNLRRRVSVMTHLYDVSTAVRSTPGNDFPIYSTDSMVNVTKKRSLTPDNTHPQIIEGKWSNMEKSKLRAFTFHTLLGSGSYGKVLLASSKPSNKLVAVKIASKRQIIEEAPEDATLERDVLEKVHGNLLFTHLHQSFQTENHLFYVMEYIGGGTLRSFRDSQTSLDLESMRLYAAELTSGLSFLHSKYIIHRDLNPDNILVTSDGHLKIADFGLSIMLDDQHDTTSGFAGTLTYAAPEVVSNHSYSYGVDWWSMGVTLYYLVTRKLPFTGRTRIVITHKILKTKPLYPGNIHREVRDLIIPLLNKNPSRRLGINGDIRRHGLFKNINWTDVETCQIVPPIRPDSIPCNTQNIISRIISSDQERSRPIRAIERRLFKGFSYKSPDWR